jgi:hypothetical protein
VHWPVHVDDLGFIPPVLIENLHPVILTVGDIDPTTGIAADIVRKIEFTRPGPRRAPAFQQLAIGRKLVDGGIAVSIRDIDVAVGRKGGMRAAAEWLAAHEWR